MKCVYGTWVFGIKIQGEGPRSRSTKKGLGPREIDTQVTEGLPQVEEENDDEGWALFGAGHFLSNILCTTNFLFDVTLVTQKPKTSVNNENS